MVKDPQKHKTVETRRAGILRAVALALGILALMAGVAYFLWLLRPQEDMTPETPAQPQTKTPAEIVPAQNVATNTEAVVAGETPAKRLEDGVEVVSSTVTTNSTGAIIEQLVLADGKRKKKIHPPKPLFENPSDQVIALAVSVAPGESMPPLPDIRNLDQDFAASLLSPIVVNETDSDEVKELKAKVMEVRAYLAEEVKDGGSVVDALLEHQKEMERIADNRLMALQELQQLQEEGDMGVARDFALKVNESFRIRGIPEIPVPEEEERIDEE